MARKPSISEVVDLVVKEEVFSKAIVQEEVDYFLNRLGLHPKYYEHFSAPQIAKHVNCLIAAKKVAQTTKSKSIKFHIEDDSAGFYLFSLDETSAQETEKLVTDFLDRCRQVDVGFSVVFMASEKPFMAGGNQKLGIYIVNRTKFNIPENKIDRLSDEDELSLIANPQFMKTKTAESLKMYQNLIRKLLNTRSTIVDVEKVTEPGQKGHVLQFAVYETSFRTYIRELSQVFRNTGVIPHRFYVESFANGVVTYTCYFPEEKCDTLQKVAEMLNFVAHFKQTPNRSQRLWNLVIENKIDAAHCIFLLAGVKYVYTFFPKESAEYLELAAHLKGNPDMSSKLDEVYRQAVADQVSVEAIYDTFVRYVMLTRAVFDDFRAIAFGAKKPFMNQNLLARVNEEVGKPLDRKIFKCLLTFNENLRMTNFFKYSTSPSAIAFRFHSRILEGRPRSMFPETPHGIYMVMGRGFYGFHIRFRDVARGGIRLIKSRDKLVYERNAQTLFEENYNLAYTQQQKNKDIPEGGSKGTILLDSDWATSHPRSESAGRDACFKYIDALLDCMLCEEVGIASHLDKPEILFFGPDEGTAEFMDMGANRAKERGYPYWKALTTGKSTHYGGVPHDVYGMTTCGVHTYVVELLKWFNEDETKIRKFMTGGPDGDLGSNEILMSKDKTIGIVDGSGVAYAPDGLDRTELIRLARCRLPIANYNSSLLDSKSFLVKVDDRDVKLPDGSMWRTGADLRDKFHLTDYASGDLFVPCGGRPASVSAKNVSKMFINGKPKFKYVVEGANLFFTDDARRALELAGVHLFKDSSANKGGVTSSSLEVFASLCMYDKDHDSLLTVNQGHNEAPQFYQDYVKEIIAGIICNCRFEFHAIMKAYDQAKKNGEDPPLKMDLTRVLSHKINRLGDYIMTVLDDPLNYELMRKVLKRAVPSLILSKFGLDSVVECTPANYLQAMAAVWIASRYIYLYGIDATEFSFYKFMRCIETEDFSEAEYLEEMGLELPSRRGSQKLASVASEVFSDEAGNLTPHPHKYPPKVKQLALKERPVADPSATQRKGTYALGSPVMHDTTSR